VAVFIAFRFEWRMAIAAILAMLHDVLISVGIYSLFQFLVTPATVIAFLTILGYSLYDTVVVFDRIRENERRSMTRHPLYADIINTSMNQVLMRSLNTSFSAIVPVLSLLVVGTWIMGQTALSEFAIALLIGMLTGAYSSILIAVPILYWLKQTDPEWRSTSKSWATGEELRQLVMVGGAISSRRGARGRGSATEDVEVVERAQGAPSPPPTAASATAVLSHPPRPRKKTRR
jgi:preprotein translocase subunit SecF